MFLMPIVKKTPNKNYKKLQISAPSIENECEILNSE